MKLVDICRLSFLAAALPSALAATVSFAQGCGNYDDVADALYGYKKGTSCHTVFPIPTIPNACAAGSREDCAAKTRTLTAHNKNYAECKWVTATHTCIVRYLDAFASECAGAVQSSGRDCKVSYGVNHWCVSN